MPQKEKGKESSSFSDEECKKAAEKAMSLLLFKDRTQKELMDKLYQAGFSEKASAEALEYVTRFGYINDQRYVENYIMFQKGKRSRKDILYRLAEKGIDKEIVLGIMEETEYGGEEEAIQILVLKKLKGRAVSEISYDEKNKIIAYLGRKGYELRTIKNVLSQLDNSEKTV